MKSNIIHAIALLLMMSICLFFIYGFVNDAKSSQKSGKCNEVYDSILNCKYYVDTDTQLGYYGGQMAIADIVQNKVKWPSSHCDIEGKVYVLIIVGPNGKISNKKIARGIHHEGSCDFDSAALKVVDYLTAWIPATCDGKKVSASFFLPIEIKFQ